MPETDFDRRMAAAPYAAIWDLTWPQVAMMMCHFLIGFADVWVAGRIDRETQACMGVMSQAMFFFRVIEAKMEFFDYLREHKGRVFINIGNSLLNPQSCP